MKNELFRFVQVRPVKRTVQDNSSKNLIYYPGDWKSQSKFFSSFIDGSGNIKEEDLQNTGVTKYNSVYDTIAGYDAINNFLDRIYGLMLLSLPTTETVNHWCRQYLKTTSADFIKSKNYKPYYIYLWDTILLRFFNPGISVPTIPTCTARIKAIKFISNMAISQSDLDLLVKSSIVLPKISDSTQSKTNTPVTKSKIDKQDKTKTALQMDFDALNKAEN